MNALGRIYGRVTELRRAWYGRHPERRRRLRTPVISVGNLVVGGSGKTPVVAALARLLRDAGERPVILSRGYARRKPSDGVLVVSDGRSVLVDAQASGDEPQMLARALDCVPVLVCADRHTAGLVAESRFGATVCLLDDGFQHLRLARDIDLLLVSSADLDERVLPAGRLREPLGAAHAAHALAVPAGGDEPARVAAGLGWAGTDGPVFQVVPSYDPLAPVPWKEGAADVQASSEPAPARRSPCGTPACGPLAVAMAAIARPERFFTALSEQGWRVRRERSFPDHHWFSEADIAKVDADARETGADIVVTTEKDAMRLACLPRRSSDPSAVPWLYLPMRVRLEPFDVFEAWLCERLLAARLGGGAGQ